MIEDSFLGKISPDFWRNEDVIICILCLVVGMIAGKKFKKEVLWRC